MTTEYQALFIGGPRHLDVEQYKAPPSQRLPIYRDVAPDVVCADEQVIERTGVYEKTDAGVTTSRDGVEIEIKHYVYHWRPGA